MAGTATLIGIDDDTQGSWIGVYGADGFVLPSINSGVMTNIPSSVPSYATVTQINGVTYDWVGAQVDPTAAGPTTGNSKAIQHPDFPSSRFIVAMFTADSEEEIVQISVGGTTRRIAVYVYDPDNVRETYFRITDGSSLLYQDSVPVLAPARWWVFDITGTVYLSQFIVSAPNFLISAVMFDTPDGGGTDTSLDAEPGEFTLTGSVAGLAIGIEAVPGSLALSGSPAISGVGLVATPGTLTLTSFPAELVASGNAVLDAQPGTLTLTGFPAGFAIGFAVTPSNLAISGQPASFSLTFAASPLTFTLTGLPATLVASGDEPLSGRVICLAGADRSVTTLAGSDAFVTSLPGRDRSIATIAIDVDC